MARPGFWLPRATRMRLLTNCRDCALTSSFALEWERQPEGA